MGFELEQLALRRIFGLMVTLMLVAICLTLWATACQKPAPVPIGSNPVATDAHEGVQEASQGTETIQTALPLAASPSAS